MGHKMSFQTEPSTGQIEPNLRTSKWSIPNSVLMSSKACSMIQRVNATRNKVSIQGVAGEVLHVGVIELIFAQSAAGMAVSARRVHWPGGARGCRGPDKGIPWYVPS